MEQSKLWFDGDTYEAVEDQKRLATQTGKVWTLMRDGKWRTLPEIANATGAPEASISARLRDLRKDRFGGHKVDRHRSAHGLYLYRLRVNPEHPEISPIPGYHSDDPEPEELTPITDLMNGIGLPPDRLRKALDGRDNWGKMIHAFEYLTACGLLLQLADNESKET